MKRCPKCRRDYYDDTLLYCLDDGNALLDGPAISGDDVTVVMPPFSFRGENLVDGEDSTRLFDADATVIMPAAGANAVPRSIAVLPFANMSTDPENEYFCDGLAEELINALSKIDRLKVVARTSAFSFKGSNANVSSIGDLLKVNTILEGSVQKSGERLRINVQLVNAADGFYLWSERYDREIVDIFDLQDEVTASVIDSLRSKLVGYDQPRTKTKRYTSNVEAYEHYLQGRFFLNKMTVENFDTAIGFFEQALSLDPGYALAYAGLSDAYVLLCELGPLHAADAMLKARENALKAISLDNDLSEAHCSLGIIHRDYDFDFKLAETAFKQSIKLEPGGPEAHLSYGLLLSYLGRRADSEEQFRMALDVDPLSVIGNWIYSIALFLFRSYDDCIDRSKKALELDYDFAGAFLTLAFANQMKGNYEDAVNAYSRFSVLMGDAKIAAIGREGFAAGGWHGFLGAMTGPERPPELSSYMAAVFHTGLDEKDKAILELQRAFENRESYLAMLKIDPRLDRLRDEPAFQNLIETIGFPN